MATTKTPAKTPSKTKTKPAATSAAGLGVRPLHDKVLVRRDEAADKTDTGLYLPESSKDRPKTGVIQAVGDGSLNKEDGSRVPLTVKAGDRVIFTSYAGTEIKLGDQELLIMTEADILAVID